MKFTGLHIVGRGRASTLGFPTINLHDINTVLMEDGIYAARVIICDNHFNAALFVGESPTFKDRERSIELHLIGLQSGDIKKYHLDHLCSTRIFVETIQYLRPVTKFTSRETLILQLEKDVKEIESILISGKQ